MSFSPSPCLVFLAWENHSSRMLVQRVVCDQQYGDIYQISNQKLLQDAQAEEAQQWAQAGEAGANCGGFTTSSYQLLRAEADEDPLSVFTVVSALHECQEELGGVVLVRRSAR